MVGTVRIASAPSPRVWSSQRSAVDPSGRFVLSELSGRLMKNQSEARLVASFVQLYRVTTIGWAADGATVSPLTRSAPRIAITTKHGGADRAEEREAGSRSDR